jgi:hypothetical protein
MRQNRGSFSAIPQSDWVIITDMAFRILRAFIWLAVAAVALYAAAAGVAAPVRPPQRE